MRQKLEADKYQLEWYSYEDALVKARRENKYVMLEFYATWCKWCRKFEAETLTDPAVMKALSEGFVAVKLDGESDKAVVHEMRRLRAYELADVYEVKGFPAVWFIAPDGTRAKLLSGYLGPSDFKAYLDYITSGEYKTREF
jgi:thioredoxin-related protein